MPHLLLVELKPCQQFNLWVIGVRLWRDFSSYPVSRRVQIPQTAFLLATSALAGAAGSLANRCARLVCSSFKTAVLVVNIRAIRNLNVGPLQANPVQSETGA
jgi:hypothetical protein